MLVEKLELWVSGVISVGFTGKTRQQPQDTLR